MISTPAFSVCGFARRFVDKISGRLWIKFGGVGIICPNPVACTLYTQLHLPDGGWSVVLEFSDTPPALPSGESMAEKVSFLVESAPHELLQPGFAFDFMSGGHYSDRKSVV